MAFVIFNNQAKPIQTDENVRITEAPTEQRLEQSNSSHEKQEDEQVSFDPEAAEIKSVDTSTPVAHKDSTAKQETEAPTSAPLMNTPNPWKETEYPPTCEEDGYIVRENTVEGYTVIDEGKPALGHEYGEWKQDPVTGLYITACVHCGKEFTRHNQYSETIPRIDFTGSMDGISKSDRITLQFEFTSPTKMFSCYSYTTWQGHNSLMLPKKNYTIRLYSDEGISQKYRLVFNNWQREHKYVLKANYRDISQARNLVAANIWADMAASRSNLYEILRQTSNYGAVDGFPVVVYLNQEFIGLYTMNLHIDDDLFQMKSPHDAVLITNSVEPEECRFYSEATFTDENSWEIEYCGTGENNQWAKDTLNELINFIMTSSDEEFKNDLGVHLDVDGAVDYLIFIYVLGLKDNAVKDLVLLKYEDCDALIPSVYDMEHAFGLATDGKTFMSPYKFLPFRTENGLNSNTGSLLWDRMLQLFNTEIQARYTILRKTVLSRTALINRVNTYIDSIDPIYYTYDIEKWQRDFPEESPKEQMTNYIDERLRLLDEIFGG